MFTVENMTFYKLFPFHILMDEKLRVIQARGRTGESRPRTRAL